MSNDCRNVVKNYIKEHNLLDFNSLYLVALSGGADSVTLLLLLDELGYSVEAVHCNFHLRGDESDRDELFCAELCQQRNIPFHRTHFDTRTYAELHHVSIEMAARELRYRYFEQLRQDLHAEAICVAHHRDDSVETVLMNLLRGTGIHGLHGILPRQGRIIRPLLCLSRNDIEEYLKTIGQNYVIDSTNLKDDILRNKIRLQLIPLLHELNPAASENIQRTAGNIHQAEMVYDEAVQQVLHDATVVTPNGVSIAIDRLKQEVVLVELLQQYGFSPSQARQVHLHLKALSGRVFSSTTHDALINRDHLLIEPRFVPMKPYKIPEAGHYVLPNGQKLSLSFLTTDEPMSVNFRQAQYFDASTVRLPLTVRHVIQGDRFQPLGMEGSRLLSDYMTDRKFSLFQKRRQLVVTDATGEIIWLIGERPNHRHRVQSHTRQLLVLTRK